MTYDAPGTPSAAGAPAWAPPHAYPPYAGPGYPGHGHPAHGYPPYGAPSYGPPLAPGTNGWAVASAVLGVLALVPLAVVAGVVALHQLRQRPQAGRGWAITGLVASGVWSGLGVLGLLAWSLSLFFFSPYLVEPAGPHSVVAGLSTGDCFDDAELISGRGRGASPQPATPVPCAQLHDAEVYASVSLYGAAPEEYDGEQVAFAADDVCYERFDHYVGASYEWSEYEYATYAPDEAEWADGEHRATCVLIDMWGDATTGSARGSAR